MGLAPIGFRMGPEAGPDRKRRLTGHGRKAMGTMRSDRHHPGNDSLAPRRESLGGRESIEPELLSLDRALARVLTPSGSHVEESADDAARCARIFAASRELLPVPGIHRIGKHDAVTAVDLSGRGSDGHFRAPGRAPWIVSRARIAIAAAAVVTLAVGSIEAMRHVLRDLPADPSAARAVLAQEDPGADPASHSSADPATPGAAEATLIALLAPGDRAFDGERGWMDERAFTGTAAARSVAPVLEIRGADIDDFAAELGSILGVVSLRPL